MFFLLKDRHIVEYQESMQKIEALRNSTGVTTFTVKVCTVDLSLFLRETTTSRTVKTLDFERDNQC